MLEDVMPIAQIIGNELGVESQRVAAAIRLLDEEASVPFIARYRKEVTQSLNDTELRHIAYRLGYIRELNARRATIIASIQEQGQLTPSLELALQDANTKTRLEDLYLPYRPKRRTKAYLAKEAGLEPLADRLYREATLDPTNEASAFINLESGIDSIETALDGARQILMERFAEEPDLLAELRQYLWQNGVLSAKGCSNNNDKKFADYAHFAEPIRKIRSHRALALFRGRREQALQLTLSVPNQPHVGEEIIRRYFQIDAAQASPWLMETVQLTWTTKLAAKLELDLFNRLREAADEEAITVFANNLRDLLLAPPAGAKVIMGLDPGIRTGVKVAVVDETGKLLDYDTVFPLPPQSAWHEAIAALAKLAAKYRVNLISIGNGTGSRETERLVAELMTMYPDLGLTKILVSEAGASVYSASQLAADEFSELDVSLRGAISIARRLQDPLAELVKIEPKSIGVGQYQHDVNQTRLARSLDGVVEMCVNAVGVDVNLASWTLLSHIAGLSEAMAKQIVAYREEHGAFACRDALKNVPRMGEKTFEQAIGFLRVRDGLHPLDTSGIHPESYPIVERMAQDLGLEVTALIGQKDKVHTLDPNRYVDAQTGLPTIQDILVELEKPGRDPRPQFKTVRFKEGVDSIEMLEVGMVLEGVVSNVTHFGAFVDIGVHQDGLVHISAMTDRFISDPRELAKAGDIITVKVTEVDKERKRIGLTMKLQDEIPSKPIPKKPKHLNAASTLPNLKKLRSQSRSPTKPSRPMVSKPLLNTAMADALSKLKSEIK
jgi:uncharacterized protein